MRSIATSSVIRGLPVAQLGLLAIALGLIWYVSAGVLTERYREILVTGALLQVAWVAVRWRTSVFAFIIYVTIEGFLINYFHNVPELNLVKDLFAIASFGVLAAILIIRNHSPIFPRAKWTVPFYVFAGFYLLQVLNPALPNVLVGLVGVRTTLLFAVLVPVGYWFLDSRERFFQFLEFLMWLSLPVSAFGILQSIMGPAWMVAMSPGFDRAVFFAVGSQGFNASSYFRTFSTFVHTGGFSLFLSMTLLVTLTLTVLPAWRRRRLQLAVAFAVQFWAFLTTGGRGAFLVLMASVAVLLMGHTASRRLLPVVLLIPAVFFGSSFLTGGGFQERYETLLDFDYLAQRNVPLVGGWLSEAMNSEWTGSGAGYASVASRYVGVTPLNGGTVENGLAKIRFEAGLPGLVLYLVFIAAIIFECITMPAAIRDPELRLTALTLSIFVFCNVVLVVAGCPFDVSPTNTLLWLFLGMMARVPALAANPGAGGVRYVVVRS